LGVVVNSAFTTVPFISAAATGSFWCFALRNNGSCLGRSAVLVLGVVRAFFLALDGSTLAALVRTGETLRPRIRWSFSLALAAAFVAASVAMLSLVIRVLRGFAGTDCGHLGSIELRDIDNGIQVAM
jgi:hypothetical protein